MGPALRGGTQDTDFNKGFTKGIFTKFLPIFSVKFRALKLRFLAFPGVLEGLGRSGRLVGPFPPILVPNSARGNEL